MLSLTPACDNVAPMRAARAGRLALICAVALALAALGAALPGSAAARATFRPRIGFAMGIVPPLHSGETAAGPATPVVYHGGAVMRHVTLHTIFWAPPGYGFTGSPGPGTLGYEALVRQFLVDAAHDSGSSANLFSTLVQYHDGAGRGSYEIAYDPAVDSVDVSDPYPPRARQCASPSGVATCVTDLELQQKIDQVAGPSGRSARGLSNLWLVFLPPDVDTCTDPGACATNAYAGYHSVFDSGHGVTVYIPVPDPLVEATPSPGSDPEGNPEAESTLDTVAHEIEEAITDPVGTAWMDPNGYETADKCENGPVQGTPLGYAADGSPYNQMINGHEYLLQDMWSNAAGGCVQASPATGSPLPLHTVELRQYSSAVSGRLGLAKRVPVRIALLRAGVVVALAGTRTRENGSWGPVTLRSRRGAAHAVGDDRDQISVSYGSGPRPTPDLIQTGSGGNPFTASGYTGWFDLDNGYAVGSGGVELGPCSQTGVLSLSVAGSPTQPPAQLCGTESDASVVPTPAIGPGTALSMSSLDNRAESLFEPDGALVKLTVSLGEPGSVSALGNAQLAFQPTGFPSCTAFVRVRLVSCSGLVPGARYTLDRRAASAGVDGTIHVGGLRLRGGELLTLRNAAGRRLTALHVARLRVDIVGEQTRIASGTCQAGDYYGGPLVSPPTTSLVGSGGPALGATICPPSGSARGLSSKVIAQTDDFSGGQTVTQVPLIESTAPLADETLYGAFTASAQSGLPGPAGSIVATGVPVALTITQAASPRSVFHSSNVDAVQGVVVPALAPGSYVARWVLRDAAGDTRTVTTRFVDEA